MKKKMTVSWWSDRVWIYVSCVLSALMYALVLLNWNTWDMGVKILAGIAILIPIHVVEEWIFPGGFHYQYNVVLNKSDYPNQYPMNRFSDMFTNFVTTIFYMVLVAISVASGKVHPGFILGTAIFCLLELFAHTGVGIVMYLKFRNQGKKTIYGPGSITAYWVFVPLGVLSYYWLQDYSLTGTDWLVAIGLLAFIAVVCILIPEKMTKNIDTPYFFKNAGYYEQFLKQKENQ